MYTYASLVPMQAPQAFNRGFGLKRKSEATINSLVRPEDKATLNYTNCGFHCYHNNNKENKTKNKKNTSKAYRCLR